MDGEDDEVLYAKTLHKFMMASGAIAMAVDIQKKQLQRARTSERKKNVLKRTAVSNWIILGH